MIGYERNAEGKIVAAFVDEHGPVTQEQIDLLKVSQTWPETPPPKVELLTIPPPKNFFVADQLEVILGGSQGDTRQARRRFYRLVQKHWPLTLDPVRHKRLKEFVEQYAALEAGGFVK